MNASPGFRLLIVDDDARIRELADYAAHRAGHFDHIVSVNDGQAAIEWLEHATEDGLPTVILTDLSMPRMDGLELVARLQQDARWRDIPVAMFSSSNRPNDEALALQAGCRVFFPKPVSLEDLVRIMHAVAELVHKPAGAGH